ncbi:hypothetical protein [Kutzneria sp. NPDC051319]|uniref:hypothetical protein n=1 Tax=Kutzneria sp. NPDC051319 TaxID=3155047 RepID=UPI00341B222D
MPHICPPADADLADATRAQLDAFADAHGHLGDVRRIFAHQPAALAALDNQYALIVGSGQLDRWVREAVFAACSAARGNPGLAEALRAEAVRHGADADRLDAILAEPADDAVGALITFARKMAIEPYKAVEGDVEALHDAGWSDANLVEALTVVSLSAYLDIMSLTLRLDAGPTAGGRQWH